MSAQDELLAERQAKIIKLTALNAELVAALEAALKTAEFEKHPFRPWHQQAKDVLAKSKGDL